MGKSVHISIKEMSYPTHRSDLVPVLQNINFSAEAGEFVTVLGPSGCGKTSILRLIAGLEHTYEGVITVNGCKIKEPGPDRGFVFQSFSSFPWFTVEQNVLSSLRELPKHRAKKRVREYLELVGLTEYADTYPTKLSGGQQQRVAIARTLAMQPDVLLMDEPYAALDAQSRENMQSELLRLWLKFRPTVLFVTHDINEAALLGQKIIVLSKKPSCVFECIETRSYKPDNWLECEQPDVIKILNYPAFHELTSKLRVLISEACSQ